MYIYTNIITLRNGIRVHSSVVRAADCRSAGPWFKSGCALLPMPATENDTWGAAAWVGTSA